MEPGVIVSLGFLAAGLAAALGAFVIVKIDERPRRKKKT